MAIMKEVIAGIKSPMSSPRLKELRDAMGVTAAIAYVQSLYSTPLGTPAPWAPVTPYGVSPTRATVYESSIAYVAAEPHVSGAIFADDLAAGKWITSEVAAQKLAYMLSTPYTGSGSPEGVVTAVVGKMYVRTDGGAGTTLYVKESGAGNTGWVGK